LVDSFFTTLLPACDVYSIIALVPLSQSAFYDGRGARGEGVWTYTAFVLNHTPHPKQPDPSQRTLSPEKHWGEGNYQNHFVLIDIKSIY
jgi:hypothetical protein